MTIDAILGGVNSHSSVEITVVVLWRLCAFGLWKEKKKKQHCFEGVKGIYPDEFKVVYSTCFQDQRTDLFDFIWIDVVLLVWLGEVNFALTV